MAASRVDYLEETRPPENPTKPRCPDSTLYNYKYYYKSPASNSRKLSMGAISLPSGIILNGTNNSFVAPDASDNNFNSELTEKLILTENANENNQSENQNKENGSSLKEDVNFNKIISAESAEQCNATMTSPRRVMKSNSCRETYADNVEASSQTKRPTSLAPEERKRGSYHRDVEEALSSLLWQPYEYRTTRSDSLDTLSSTLSSASSSCASLSLDATARGMMQSFTDEFLNVTTSLPAQQHSGNNADPNLSSQMVSNLMALKSTTAGAPNAQSGRVVWSRGYDGGSAASQVDWERSSECAFVPWSTCGSAATATSAKDYSGRVPCASVLTNTVLSCVRDVKVLSASDMRVEIPGPGSQPQSHEVANRKPPDVLQQNGTQSISAQTGNGQERPQTTHHHRQNAVSAISLPGAQEINRMGSSTVPVGLSSSTTPVVLGSNALPVGMSCGTISVGENGNRGGFMQTNGRCSVNMAISSDMIPSNITSVVSANVVGLPVHSRSSSNLSNNRSDILQPNHPRSVSETASNVFVQHQLGNHFRSSSNLTSTATQSDRNNFGVIPVPNHLRQNSAGLRGASEPPINITHSSEVAQHRSSLVPNSELVVNHTKSNSETRTLSEDSSRVPPLPNVSNVNVNFYRAVPVNVVSSVPTIQCINSVEDTGNNVSNVHIVQAMPATIPSVSVQTSEVSVQQTAPAPSFEVRTRTFTSTEAQTDDTVVGLIAPTTAVNTASSTREQRRRERRERRHQRRLNTTNHQHPSQSQQWPTNSNERLPDLLNSHLPPPYSTLPQNISQSSQTMVPPNNLIPTPVVTNPVIANSLVPFHPGVVPGQVPLVPGQVPLVPGPPPVPVPTPSGFRFPFPSAAGFRR